MRTLLARLAPVALLALPMMLVGGCKKLPYPQCKKDKHCKVDLGEKCVDGQCQNCTTDADCVGKAPDGGDWVCHEFRCSDPNAIAAGGGPGELGSPCTQTIDCSGGLVCTAGKCSQCTDDIECNGGTCDLGTGTCITGGAGGGSCTTDDECAMDEICDMGTCIFSGIEPSGTNPCGLDAVYFGFDSPKIEDDAAQQLRDVAECLKTHGSLVYLEAHADPRGTEEYNIMLTDRRGQGVKKFLVDLGVSGENLQVISKGSLEATGTDESGWKQDRRVEFVFP